MGVGGLVPVLEAAMCKTVGSRGILRTQGSLPLFRRQPPSSSHCHVRAGWWEPAMHSSAQDIMLRTCSGSIYTAAKAADWGLFGLSSQQSQLFTSPHGLPVTPFTWEYVAGFVNFLILQGQLNPGFLCKMCRFLKFHVKPSFPCQDQTCEYLCSMCFLV